MRRANAKLISIDAGNDRQRHQRQPPVERQQHDDGDDQPDQRDRRRDDRHLQQAGRRVDVAGEARQDAAGLHVPELRQRQVQQPIEQRPPQRQHHAHVEQLLAVVLAARRPGCDDDDHAEEQRRRPGAAATGARRVSSVVFSRTRSMMNRMNSGSIISQAGGEQREHEDAADGVRDAARASAGTRAGTRGACRSGTPWAAAARACRQTGSSRPGGAACSPGRRCDSAAGKLRGGSRQGLAGVRHVDGGNGPQHTRKESAGA